MAPSETPDEHYKEDSSAAASDLGPALAVRRTQSMPLHTSDRPSDPVDLPPEEDENVIVPIKLD